MGFDQNDVCTVGLFVAIRIKCHPCAGTHYIAANPSAASLAILDWTSAAILAADSKY